VSDPLDAGFTDWLSARVGAPARITPFETPGHGGFSHVTLLTTADWGDGARGLVVRLPPEGRGLFPEYDLDQQVRVLRALHADGTVPVPEVLWVEPDAAVLGRPFYVMARIDGRIPPDRPGYHFEGWVKELAPDAQARVLQSGLGAMAKIHSVDVAGAGLELLDRAELPYWRAYLDWVTGGVRVDPLEVAWDWCVEHRPPEPAVRGLVWGDARLGNLVYDDHLAVRAVLDWEMATLGPPELDLGWYLFLESAALAFTEPLPGFPDRAGTIAAYEQAAGRPLEHLDWYEAWGGFRVACIQVAMTTDPTLAGRDPVTRLLLDRLQ
jgi:aminoglycoside phosphotransferase (APT) family kinase protein